MGARILLAILIAAAPLAVAQAAEPEARQLFAKVPTPAPLEARSIGFYTRGCLAGAKQLAVDGPAWQAMRLSRNRYWGMPELVAYIERLAKDARARDGWNGLLVGDMSQPRGGPMLTGHSSHQVGLDVDIWFDQMPDRTLSAGERENIGATSYIKKGTNTELDRSKWTEAHNRLIKRAASYPEVQRIFVNAGIKQELCNWAGSDRAWLRKVRPWYKHDDHLHVRLTCPKGMSGCKPQDPTPAGDGCGENLAWWLSDAPYKPAEGPIRYKPELTLKDLPAVCRQVLNAGLAEPVTIAAPEPPVPRQRPAIN
jgi:penicillin-insensitive murein endopeptidase